MKIHIRYFASLRETTGRGEEALDIPIGASVLSVRTELIARYPDLQPIMQRCISALNRRYVDSETTLEDGDELVFIPPMGGGGVQREEVRREWNH
jgi:molybdopterin synthase sulfur carrier subunit